MSSDESPSFEQLVELARSGDRDARDSLLRTCRAYLHFIARSTLDERLRGKCEPSDIVQNAMCSANAAFDQFRGDNVASLKAWLREILRNEVAMTRRHYYGTKKRDVRRENVADSDSRYFMESAAIVDSMPTPSSEAVLREDAAELRSAMQRLPEDYRSILLMRNWDRMSFLQIAQRLGRSENAVKKLWARALAKLESQLFPEQRHG